MKNFSIAIKFKKEVILSRTNVELKLKDVATEDNFLNQFAYKSVVTDEMILPQKKMNKVNFENLVGICYVQGLNKMPLEEKKILAKKMAAYDFVEYAYVEIVTSPELPTYSNKESINTTDNQIPAFTQLQTYKDGIEVSHIGIDMEYAWSTGITGQGICGACIEEGFNFDHINLKRDSFINPDANILDAADSEHGTAVASILYANDLGYGVKGLIYGADKFYAATVADPTSQIGNVLARILSYMKEGDVISISLIGPADYYQSFWDIAKEGIAAGIIICEVIGNAGTDTDTNENLDEWRNRPDIGLIRVGAGTKNLIKASFSSYGSRVHLQAWGNYDVVTAGYGDLYNGGANENYSATFGGTSSAAPIVASAAIAVQSWYKKQTGKVLSPFEMRDLLINTGIPQTQLGKSPIKHIGPIPNVKNAINELQEQLTPSLIRAVITGPTIVYAGNSVILSAEKSQSTAGDITSYVWQLPTDIPTDILNKSRLHFTAPDLATSQKISVKLAVTDAQGNSTGTEHEMIISTLPQFPSWNSNRPYLVDDIVNWKNKNWIALVANVDIEPGTNAQMWKEFEF